jgi:ribosomal-protein-alanine N-acetyltransferase
MSRAESAPTRTWPVVLRDGNICLRPLRYRDRRAWDRVRSANVDWLAPWEATQPDESVPPPTYGRMVRALRRAAIEGRMLPFVVEVDGSLAGQVTVGGVMWGSLRSAQIGYWVDQRFAGRGVIPTAVALVTDHCFQTLGMHRLEVNIRPENVASLRVVEKLGFRLEGLRKRYLHINGEWHDHLSFALTAEEVPQGLLAVWRS